MAESSAIPLTPRLPLRLVARTDARLVKLASAGDERAFAAIYERYHQELYRYCLAILGDPQEAQDALQSTMASALRALPGETRAIALRPWLYRVARNEAVTLLRRREPVLEASEAQLPLQAGADAEFDSRERMRNLVTDLITLPERQRSALVMRELSGMTHEEIAGALDISDGAARQVVYEARQGLLELEEGRAMECEPVRKALSERDGRVLRGRKLRAHLRGCEGCKDFQAAIAVRTADLELLAPPLSAMAASGVLASLLGGSSAGTGAGALVAGGAVGGGAVGTKALGIVAASAVLGVGAGKAADVRLPILDSDPAPERAAGPGDAAPGSDAPGKRDAASAAGPAGRADQASSTPGRDGAGAAQNVAGPGRGAEMAGAHGNAAGTSGAQGRGNGNAHGQEDDVPPPTADNGASQEAHGNGNAYGHEQDGDTSGHEPPGNAYGHDKTSKPAKPAAPPKAPPGLSETKTTGPPPHSNAGGASGKSAKSDK